MTSVAGAEILADRDSAPLGERRLVLVPSGVAGHATPTGLAVYFSGLPHYVIEPGRAVYWNQDTDIRFTLDFATPAVTGCSRPPRSSLQQVVVTMPRFPAVFALEADIQLQALASEFDLVVRSGDGSRHAYSPSCFVGDGSAGARLTPDRATPYATAPAQQVQDIWRWNYARRRLQDAVGPNIAVARVHWLRTTSGQARSTVIWSDAIPKAFPPVDLLLLIRDRLGVRSGLGQSPALATYSQLEPCLRLAALVRNAPEGMPPYHLFDYTEPPPELVRFFSLPRPHRGSLPFVPADRVIEVEAITGIRQS